jgi:peptidyl-prolyl cis-trans isomerase SurA
MTRRLLLAIVLAVVTLGAAPGPVLAQQTLFRPVAVVNDRAITGYDLQQRMQILSILGFQAASQEALQRAALDALIEDRLKVQEGKRLGLSPTPEGVEQVRGELAGRLNTTPDALTALFAAQGVGDLAVEDFLGAEAVWRDVVRTRFARRVDPGEADIDAEIANLAGTGVTSYRLREIGLPSTEGGRGEAATRELAERISTELSEGADFGEAVRRYSRSPSAQRAGEVGWVSERNLPPDLSQALASLEPGQVSAPLPVPGGFSIIQVMERRVETREGVDTSDPETRERVRRALMAERSGRLSEGLLQELRRDALIELR